MPSALQVLPPTVAKAVAHDRHWFLIGGQAVRCFVPYRPTHDVDFGVTSLHALKLLEAHLHSQGHVELIERAPGTVHLNFEGIDISLFVLPHLKEHIKNQVLTLTGLLATKVHALLDRGTRRDFFDLYVLLDTQRSGLGECIEALHTVYRQPVNQGLLLRALCYFDDAEAEAPLPGEGAEDWNAVKAFFSKAVGALVVPPTGSLGIQRRVVELVAKREPQRSLSSKKRRKPRR